MATKFDPWFAVNTDMISNIKDWREEIYDLNSNLKEDISSSQKKVDILNVEFDNINQYEHGDGLLSLEILFRMAHQLKMLKILFSIYSGIT